jgi:hypothetical protein
MKNHWLNKRKMNALVEAIQLRQREITMMEQLRQMGFIVVGTPEQWTAQMEERDIQPQ